MTQDKLIDIDILEYLQFIIHKGIIPSDVTLNKAVAEIESLRSKLAEQPTPSQSVDERAVFEKCYPIPSYVEKLPNNDGYTPKLKDDESAKMVCYALDNRYIGWIDKARAQLSKPQPTSQDAERFYNLGFKASGEGHNGEYGANVNGDYYLANRKKAIDAAMKECK